MKKALIKALIILIPTYSVAFLTEMMVYTIPMLAASSIFATSLYSKNKDELRVDEDSAEIDDNETDESDFDSNINSS
tara:strand:- start:1138 stop:1368 length:231 start_codon:yes stop_codon:yes gene_type:complete